MRQPPRYVLDTALSIEDTFYHTDDFGEEARTHVERIKALVSMLSLETTVRDEPIIERLPEDESHVLEELDDLLAACRTHADAWFDDLRDQIMFSAEWWLFVGTPLETCPENEVRMVVGLQDLKYQVPEIFEEEMAHLDRCKGACAIQLFGNDARNHDFSHLDFSAFEGLELLDMSQNKLSLLPDGISEHDTLRWLDLSQNERLYLDEGDAETWETPELEHLDVSQCPVEREFVETMHRKYPNTTITS